MAHGPDSEISMHIKACSDLKSNNASSSHLTWPHFIWTIWLWPIRTRWNEVRPDELRWGDARVISEHGFTLPSLHNNLVTNRVVWHLLGLPTIPYFRDISYFNVCVLCPGLGLPGMQNVPYYRYSHTLACLLHQLTLNFSPVNYEISVCYITVTWLHDSWCHMPYFNFCSYETIYLVTSWLIQFLLPVVVNITLHGAPIVTWFLSLIIVYTSVQPQ